MSSDQEVPPTNTLQNRLKLARCSIVHYSSRLKKKQPDGRRASKSRFRKRKSIASRPNPAALLLKAALEQPALDHAIIPITAQSSDDESLVEEQGQSNLLSKLRSTLKEVQKCSKLIDEQMRQIKNKKDMSYAIERFAFLQISISALSDSAVKFVELAEQEIDQLENSESANSSSMFQLSDENIDEFYDALDTSLTLKPSNVVCSRVSENNISSEQKMIKRRTRVPNRPSNSINYLSFLRNCLSQSKDLSKVGMPVDFNEPLSALQRSAEDLNYSFLLDDAANESDPLRRLALVAIYALSAYSTTAHRTSKPFNPLLSETFELDRRQDRGFIAVAEQTYTPTTKIKGRSLYLNPIGSTYINFTDSPNIYVYGKATTVTTMTNLVSGKLQTEQTGEVVVKNTGSGDKCILKFHEPGYFSSNTARKVNGTVFDSNNKPHYKIESIWDKHAILSHLETQTLNLVWKADTLPKDADKMHNFTQFAIELNEFEEGLPPTDSRYRIDQRVMEGGDWPRANQLKQQLEEAQRRRRKEREDQGIVYKPYWFRMKEPHERLDDNDIYAFDESYLHCKQTQDWSRCPRIFDI